MHKRIRYVIALGAFCALVLLPRCADRDLNEDWIDDGHTYVCLECYAAVTLPCCGNCILCNAEIGTVSYKYCYDCAKALHRCQMCAVKRY